MLDLPKIPTSRERLRSNPLMRLKVKFYWLMILWGKFTCLNAQNKCKFNTDILDVEIQLDSMAVLLGLFSLWFWSMSVVGVLLQSLSHLKVSCGFI